MFVDFLANNYLWFLVITIVLIFALIGYLVDTKEQKKNGAYQADSKELEQKFEDLAASAVSNKSIQDYVSTNATQNSFMNTTSNTNQAMETLNDNPFVNHVSEPVNMDMTNPVSEANSFEVLHK